MRRRHEHPRRHVEDLFLAVVGRLQLAIHGRRGVPNFDSRAESGIQRRAYPRQHGGGRRPQYTHPI